MNLVDTHCHLDFNLFESDLEDVLQRAQAQGVERILVPGIDLLSSQRAVALSSRYEMIYAAVGVHPNEALKWEGDASDALWNLVDSPKVVAIGEIGLDYYRESAPHAIQQQVFRAQLDLARECSLPVIIHNRQATDDILTELERWVEGLPPTGPTGKEYPGVLHSFSGNIEAGKRAVKSGFFLGVCGPVTYPKADDLRSTISAFELDNLLIETDAPFLTPQAHRGQRNEPAHVYFVAEKLSELYDLPISDVAKSTAMNASRIFKW